MGLQKYTNNNLKKLHLLQINLHIYVTDYGKKNFIQKLLFQFFFIFDVNYKHLNP